MNDVIEVRDGRAWLVVHMTKGQKVPCTGYGCTHHYHGNHEKSAPVAFLGSNGKDTAKAG